MNKLPKSQKSKSIKTPWHIWLIGILGLIWNSIGVYDFIMAQTKNKAYLSSFTPEQLSFFYGLPFWVVVAWAISVWGGLIGIILLLCRRAAATWWFLVSFVGILLTTFNNFVLSKGMEVIGDTTSLVFTSLIILVALGFYLYSVNMQRKGILR
ncbi:MAG: hypothetical protein H0U73_13645 [Tatlockia sp.]|nr:hypothetical protein [Tatlockia sp.]